jgi:hypothetical protein
MGTDGKCEIVMAGENMGLIVKKDAEVEIVLNLISQLLKMAPSDWIKQTTVDLKPRYTGGVLAIGLFVHLLAVAGHSYIVSIAVPLIWAGGVLLGGRYRFFIWLFSRRERKAFDVSVRWSGALCGGLIVILVTTLVLQQKRLTLSVLSRSGPAIQLCYGTSKLGCWIFDCCG